MREGVKKTEQENLWERLGNICLSHAIALLERGTAPTVETVETAKALVEMAVSIDTLNLRWAQQNQCGVAVFQDRISSPRTTKN